MEGGNISFWGQLFIGLLGGLISGGIVSLIEVSRFRREKKHWRDEDKKIEISIIKAESGINRWNANDYADEEKLRIYDSGLNGKVHIWRFIIKISLANLTDQAIMAHSLNLEIPAPKFIKPQKQDKKFFTGYKYQTVRKYNMLDKTIIEDFNLPLIIPPHSKTGIVFLGHYEYDYPNLVEEILTSFKFIMEIDDNKLYDLQIITKERENVYELSEIGVTDEDALIHWIPYLDKNSIAHDELPF